MLLYNLISADLAAGDAGTAAYAAEKMAALAGVFDLSPYTAAAASFQLAMAEEDAPRAVALLRTMLSSLAAPWALRDSPLYRRIPAGEGDTGMEKLTGPLLNGLMQDPACTFLRESREFQDLLTELKAELSAEGAAPAAGAL